MQFKAKGPGRGEEGGEQKTNLGEKKLDANRKGECFGRYSIFSSSNRNVVLARISLQITNMVAYLQHSTLE